METHYSVHAMTKGQLAQEYFPYSSPDSARRQLRRWIQMRPDLQSKLAQTGVRPKDHMYTPAQVQIIVDVLGAP